MESENKFVEIDLFHYLRLFKTRWWLLVLLGALAGAGGFFYGQMADPVYRASTTLLIDSAFDSPQQDLSDLRADEVRAQTYSQLITQRSVLEETIDTLSLRTNAARLRSQVAVLPIAGTQLMRITVERDSAETAAVVANTIATTFIRQYAELQSANYSQLQEELQAQLATIDETIQETTAAIQPLQGSQDPDEISQRLQLETILAQYRQSYATVLQSYEQTRLSEFAATSKIVVSETAIVPGSPVRPNRELILLLTTLGGLVTAVLIVLIQDLLDDSLKNGETINKRFGLNIISQIGHFEAEAHPLVTFEHPRSPTAEAFRNFRMNLKYLTVDKPLKTILVTSANESEGKSTVAANLAIVLARGGQETILIDGDLRRPKVNRLFKMSNNRGLTELFINPDLDLGAVAHKTEVPGLSVITAGATPPNPSELLDTKRARKIIGDLVETADVVVIDSPPLLAVTDAMALSQYVDGVILTVRVTKTKGGMLNAALEKLHKVNANILGVILVDIDHKAGNYDQYYFSYGEYSAYLEQPEKNPKMQPGAATSSTNGNGHYSTEEAVVTE